VADSQDANEFLSLSDEGVVRVLLNLIDAGEKELRSRTRRYDHNYDVYRATEKRPASLEPWQSKLRVPYGLQSIDTALVNIVSGFPRCMVTPRHPDVELNAKAMQVVMDYFVAEDHMVEAQPLFAQQGLVYGVTAAKVHWLYRTAEVTRNDFASGMQISEQVVVRDGPTFEPWNIYDVWWDANARSVDQSRYVVLRSWLTRDELNKLACTVQGDHNEADCDGIYHNVDELLKVGPTQQRGTTAQTRAMGGERDRNKGLYEILEIWTDDTVSNIGSRQVLLRNRGNPYWHGRKPIVVAQQRPDMFEMAGIAETELIDHLQSGMWTLQNMVIDNLHLTTMRGVTYREGGVTDPNKLQLKPRFKWPVVDHDDIKPFEVPPLTSDVYNERQRMLSDMQLVTGINPYVSGADMQAVDQNTATGVTALTEVASRLLRFKASQFQYKGYQRAYEMWGDMIQQFLDHDIWAKITGPTGEEAWAKIGPTDITGHFKYVLEGSEESLSRQQERGEALALLNAFAPLAQLGFINFKPILERVAIAYGFPNPDSLFMPPPAPPGAAAPTQPGQQNGAPPQQGAPQTPDQQDFYNIRGPQIGEGVYTGRKEQAGGIQMDPALIQALSRLYP
jgi:hypothetical protein